VIGGVLRILVLALVMLVAVMFMLPRPGPQVATMLDAPRELPAVALIDQEGAPFAPGDLAGRPTLVFFGFTNCPDICPTTLAVIAAAVRDLRERSAAIVPQVLFVSVDPARDSPAQIKRYLSAFDADFMGATADANTLAPLLETLAVTVHIETRGDETFRVTHNGTIYVLDQQGRWAALFGGSTHQADDLIRDYLAMRRSL
jgi:protein SCO1/2